MPRRHLLRTRRRCSPWGALLALLALAAQVTLGAMVLPSAAEAQERSAAALETLAVLCTDAHAPVSGTPHPHRHDGCAACVLCAAALHALARADGPVMPLPPAAQLGRPAAVPAARAPPAQPRATPPPTGPPALA